MKTFTTVGLLLCAAAGLSYAETFGGKLMDADCYREKVGLKQQTGEKTYESIAKACAPTKNSSAFAVRITDSAHYGHVGLTLKLDEKGNQMAASELQSGTLKKDHDRDVHVIIKGDSQGDSFYTSSVKPQPGHGPYVEE